MADHVHETLRKVATLEPLRRLDAPAVQQMLGLQSAYLAGLIVRHFDRDNDGALTAEELSRGLEGASGGDDMRRLRFTFELFDHDGNGLIDAGEFERLVSIGLLEHGVVLSPRWASETAASVFRDVDLDGDGQVTFGEFCMAVGRAKGFRTMAAQVVGAAPSDADETSAWWSEHGRGALVTAAYATVNVAAFAWAAAVYYAAGANGYVQVARGFGRVLDVNLLLLLLPTMRATLSRLRRAGGRALIPLDDTIGMHRAMGHVVWAASVGHGAAHAANYASQSLDAAELWSRTPVWTGALLLLLGGVMWLCALPFVRSSQRFELFWLAHRAWVPWVLLALAHTPSTWPWMALPVAGLCVEHALRRGGTARASRALSIEPLASGVTRVTVERPAGFTFRAGDYVYLRVPSLARGEWHPFTVSSAPERAGVFTLHVRSLGNWTRGLHELARTRERVGARLPLEVSVDGPYGTPSSHIFEARVPVLVAAGIGVTPFASILESLLWRARATAVPGGATAIERVYFVWVARDQTAFEWFAELLGEIERSEVAGRFELMIHMTAGRSDVAVEGAALALDLAYAKTRRDPLTGLHTRMRFGAPDWTSLLGALAVRHGDARPSVFFCGPEGLGAQVAHAAAAHGMPYRQEHF